MHVAASEVILVRWGSGLISMAVSASICVVSLLRPDAYFEITANNRISRFFVEVDRGTEALHRILERVQQYREIYKTGLFSVSRGGTREKYRSLPFRVLFLFESNSRRDSFLQHLHVNGVRRFVLASCCDTATKTPFAGIWNDTDGKTSNTQCIGLIPHIP
jgi:hypothetical protein